jgi:hypothetical protein
MRRGILLISILVAGMILILSTAMLSHIFRHSDTKGLNVINSAGGRDRHEESKNIGSIANVSNKCLGSALWQD